MISGNWQVVGRCVLVALTMGVMGHFGIRTASADGQAMMLPVDPTPLVAVTGKGEKRFSVEIAAKPGERSAGLMFREHMAQDHGMLFVFDQMQPVGFWMKNTILPLDLVFIGEDGRIKAIEHGEPFSEAVISPGEPVRFVLELNAGVAARDGIADGDLVRHPAIASAPLPSRPPATVGDAPDEGAGNGGVPQ